MLGLWGGPLRLAPTIGISPRLPGALSRARLARARHVQVRRCRSAAPLAERTRVLP